MNDRRATQWPPVGFGDAVLEAASGAGVGITVSVLRPQLRNIHANAAAETLLGRTREELLRASPLDYIPPEDQGRFAEMVASSTAGTIPKVLDVVVIRGDGSRATLQVATAPLQVDGESAVVAFFVVVSHLREAQDAARRSEAQLRTLVESLPDGVVITQQGRVVYANEAGAELLAYENPEAMIGHSLAEHLDPAELGVMVARVREMMTSGVRHPPREHRARTVDGRIVIAELRSHLVDWDGVPSVLAVARDATERERMQAQLRRADRLAALGTLSAGVAHEINNPLAFMTLGLEALRRSALDGVVDVARRDRMLSLIQDMEEGADRIAAVVRDLRTFARTDEESRGAVDVTSLLEDAERIAAHETRHRASVQSAIEGRPIAFGGRRQLEQVLVNLLVNAGQAFAERRDENRIDIRARVEGEVVVIEIEDNGPGVSPEVADRVFDPFFTTKPAGEGTGLGLAICHRIVTTMGGDIAFESVLGRGSLVRVRLACAPTDLQLPSPRERQSSVAHPTLDVLVVDDEEALARTIANALTPGHAARAVTCGQHALDAIAQRVPDVVVCDVMMNGMGGPELYAQVRERWPQLARRFVFITGGAVTPLAARFLDETGLPRLDKPFSPRELATTIARLTRAERG